MADAPRGHLLLEGTVSRRRARSKDVTFVPEAKPKEKTRPLRVARMLALAHQCEAMIVARLVEDRAELARVLGFTRARITQLLDLTLLAPDIQEAILTAEVAPSHDTITEHHLRRVVRLACWGDQRRRWTYVTVRDST